jgi:hypothetical protein
MFQYMTGKNSSKCFVAERNSGDISYHPTWVPFESPPLDIETNITITVRRYIQPPTNPSVTPRPTGYEKWLTSLPGTGNSSLISLVLLQSFTRPDG